MHAPSFALYCDFSSKRGLYGCTNHYGFVLFTDTLPVCGSGRTQEVYQLATYYCGELLFSLSSEHNCMMFAIPSLLFIHSCQVTYSNSFTTLQLSSLICFRTSLSISLCILLPGVSNNSCWCHFRSPHRYVGYHFQIKKATH